MNNFIKFLFLLIPFQLYTQVQQEWVSRFSSSGDYYDEGISITLDNNFNVIVVGTINGFFGACKYNNSGSLLWSSVSSYHNGTMIPNKTVAIDSSNNIYITATTNLDIITLKYDSTGTQQWVNLYSTIGYSMDISKRILVSEDNFIYVLGSISPAQYDFKYLLIKYNPINGDTVWTRIFDDGGGTGPSDMILDKENNIYITGSSLGIKTIKYDSNGNLKWVSASISGDPRTITIDRLSNVYVTANEYGASTQLDCKTIKYDSNGITNWIKIYDGVGHYDYPSSIATNDSSDVFIAGTSEDASYLDHMLVVKYNTTGVLQWARNYVGINSNSDRSRKIVTDKYGDCYVTGFSSVSGPWHSQNTTIKYLQNGDLGWVQNYRYLSYGDDIANDIVLDSLNNVYITGTSYVTISDYDISTIKYSQNPIGIIPIKSEIPNKFILLQNYPNPFNPYTNIKFSIPKKSFVQLKILDILGKLIELTINQELQASEYEVTVYSSNYSSGVYFYQLSIDGTIFDTKKMVIIK